ncbi:carboxypeptidase regulatory-like domain-containing protein [Lujinxingia sediminis]|uniref:Carboxypeptidase regulatory-like domain-containing protein n=1 Tax=Lujinxingia sediminis TaxID=2480984 RepID=A0ABY0CX05_9DELT|nr:carboxypeptidase regulatory-like domain-containing protein [Lujinxingia sediminis]
MRAKDVRRGQKWWAGGVSAVGLAALSIGVLGKADEEQIKHSVESEQGVLAPYQGEEEPLRALAVDDAPPSQARWVQVLDEQERALASRVMVSAPGLWPPVVTRSDEAGYVALPEPGARGPGKEPMRFYEFLARSDDAEEPRAFWGVIQGPGGPVFAEEGARVVRAAPAADLRLGIVDPEGAPVEGAFVRLSRESLALLHLHVTTRADGIAAFRHVPPGTYYVTIDADGHSRRTLQVQHEADDAFMLNVELLKGGGLRMPEAWRAPVVQVLGQSSSASGEAAAGESMVENGASEDEVAREALEIYVADPQGAGVTGAWVEVWHAGARVAAGVSAGSRALRLQVPADVPLTLYATHPGWGEGQLNGVEAGGRGGATVRLGRPILSVPVPDRVRSMSAIEAALGQRIVDTGSGHQIDVVDPQSAAARAGVERGDALVFARRSGEGMRVTVSRGGSFVEVALPR